MLLIRAGVAEFVIEGMEITTAVIAGADLRYRARTVVSRPTRLGPAALTEVDRQVTAAFKVLPGYPGSHAITMGKTYEVEWQGITRPI